MKDDALKLTCRDCGAMVIRRIGTSGRQRERCDKCRREHARAVFRAWYARRASVEAQLAGDGFAPEDCAGCGAPINDAAGGLCPACEAGKAD